jgi:hypothetical protein
MIHETLCVVEDLFRSYKGEDYDQSFEIFDGIESIVIEHTDDECNTNYITIYREPNPPVPKDGVAVWVQDPDDTTTWYPRVSKGKLTTDKKIAVYYAICDTDDEEDEETWERWRLTKNK